MSYHHLGADADWKAWSGGSNPVGGAKVDIRLRNGTEHWGYTADGWDWRSENSEYDIVEWRISQWKPFDGADTVTIEGGVKPQIDGEKPTNPKDSVGVKKAPMSTVSAAVLSEVGVAMLEGASKYGRHNYRGVGVRASVYYDATIRHLFAWWEGEDLDPDSGMSHITKAITSLVVLRDAMIQSKVEDDRPPRSKPFYPGLNQAAAEIIEKHADKQPYHYTIKDGAAA